MFFSTITIRYDPDMERIDDASFQEFAKDKEVLSVKEHFFIYRELPHLALCVTWRPGSMAALQRIGGFGPARAEKFGKEILEIIAIE